MSASRELLEAQEKIYQLRRCIEEMQADIDDLTAEREGAGCIVAGIQTAPDCKHIATQLRALGDEIVSDALVASIASPGEEMFLISVEKFIACIAQSDKKLALG